MGNTRYLFVSYTVAYRNSTVTGDICFEFNTEDNKVTFDNIRKTIMDRLTEKGYKFGDATPAILNIQELSADVAKMLYELE